MRGGEIVRLDIPSSTKYVSVVRQTVEGIARRLSFAADDIDDLKLAVGEACTNAVKHGATPNARITIRCYVSVQGLEIEIRNTITARSTAPAIAKPPPPADMREGGLGLYLMRELMDSVELCWEEDSATVKMLKRLPGTTACLEP